MLKKFVVPAAWAFMLGALALSASAASATTVHEKSSSGPLYSGPITPVAHDPTFVTSYGDVECARATLEGKLSSNGTGKFESAAFVNSSGGSACATSVTGVTAVVTAQDLPWTLTIVHEPTKIPVSITGVALKAEFSSGLSCIYEVASGGITGRWQNFSLIYTIETKFTLGSGSSRLCPSGGDLEENEWPMEQDLLYVGP
jgi:hypothetical protein